MSCRYGCGREGKGIFVIAVCDDDGADRTYICRALETYLRNRDIDGKVIGYAGAEKLYSALESKKLKFDIIVLDVIMSDIDGMTCARFIRRQDTQVQIVFLTSSTDYVFEGYEVNAAAYLVKPVSADKLAAVLDKAIDQIAKMTQESIAITCGGVTKRILLRDILYLESKKNRVMVVLVNGECLAVYASLDEFAHSRQAKWWIRSHKSYIVNFLYVEQFAGDKFVLRNGAIIPISRLYKDNARDCFFSLLHN